MACAFRPSQLGLHYLSCCTAAAWAQAPSQAFTTLTHTHFPFTNRAQGALSFSHSERRIGFFITTPAAEAQLELDLAEGRCPLDAQNDPSRQGLALTLFTFDAVEVRAVALF